MSTTAQNTHVRFASEAEAEQAADAAFRQIEDPEQPCVEQQEQEVAEEPTKETPVAQTPSGDDEAEEMDISEEDLADPKNLDGIDKSLYFKELSMRAQHAKQLAEMFSEHQEAVRAAAKKPAGEPVEGEEPAEGAEAAEEAAEKKETGKLKLALKEQGRQEERLKAYRTKFAKNKILAKRKREQRFAKVRAESADEKDLQKVIAKSVRAAAKKQQDLAHKAAMAAVRELEAGLSEEVIKAVAMKAYAEALSKAGLEA